MAVEFSACHASMVRLRVWALGVVAASELVLACGGSASPALADDEQGGNATGGSTGGAGTTGGSNTTGGSGGGTAGSASGGSGGKIIWGNPVPENSLCAPFATRVSTTCPNQWTYEKSHWLCQQGFTETFPAGCGTEWAEIMACDLEIDCVAGYSTLCLSSLLDCRNSFVEETQCVREGAGIMCPEGSYAFVCRSAPPEPCSTTESVGSGTRACCPPFPD